VALVLGLVHLRPIAVIGISAALNAAQATAVLLGGLVGLLTSLS
jgi:hypothetical protein